MIEGAGAYIDLYTGGARSQAYLLTGYMLYYAPDVLKRQKRMARVFGLPVLWGTDPGLDGRSLSVARDVNVLSIYAEFFGGGGSDPRGVAACVRGCLNVLIDLNTVGGVVEAPTVPPLVVEDPCPGFGYMQVRHPSPCDGFFEPAVTLGQRVQIGDSPGAVSDPLGRDLKSVQAERSGVVLVLRVVPSSWRTTPWPSFWRPTRTPRRFDHDPLAAQTRMHYPCRILKSGGWC